MIKNNMFHGIRGSVNALKYEFAKEANLSLKTAGDESSQKSYTANKNEKPKI